ncbi:MAG: outer membrane protein assembly factor [Myxococcales bacterium]|nr:outer membrane protein assembly factor [Myxococcales bacterium]
MIAPSARATFAASMLVLALIRRIAPSARATFAPAMLLLALFCVGTTASAEAPSPTIERPFGELSDKPILALSVETLGRMWRSKPEIRSVSVGTPLTPEAARRAVLELEATKGFADVRAEPRAYEDGVVLRLLAVPMRRVAQLKVEATGPLPEARVRGALTLGPDSELTELSLRRARSRVVALYDDAGYDRARVSIGVSDTDEPLRVLVTVDVEPGAPRRIDRRVFVIEPKYQRIVGDLKEQYELSSGDILASDRLAEADGELSERLRQRRFLEARVEHRVVRDGERSFLFVYVHSGPRSTLRFRGQRAFDARDLEAALALDGAIDPSSAAAAERLTAFYIARGYLDARLDVAEVMREGGAVRELAVTISEGEPVRITERLFPCLDGDAPVDLRADDVARELNAFLESELPSTPFLSSVDDAVIDDGLASPGGKRAVSTRIEPASTYSPEAYKNALAHLRRVLESKGYRHAAVGPIALVRGSCDPRAAGSGCHPVPLPAIVSPLCARDASDLPLAEARLAARYTCSPDPARSLRCSPEAKLWLPLQLGPRTELYDVAFEGLLLMNPGEALRESGLIVGVPFANVAVESARARLLEIYGNAGHAFAQVRTVVEESPDKTRARVRFVITENEPVVITGYEVRGALRTEPKVALGRLALCPDLALCRGKERYFRRDLARQSEEQIATLGIFSSVSVSLENPDVVQAAKRVIISVAEQPSQYLEPRAGFSTGEGFRFAAEYGHRSVGGRAIGLTMRLEFGYLPDFLILEDAVRARYAAFVGDLAKRLERRNGVTLTLPEMGLGPRVTLSLDGIDVRDNQRDYGLSREALIPVLAYRPARALALTLGASLEVNDVTLFEEGGVAAAIKRKPALASLLRVPEGRTLAVSQRGSVTWDRRDDPFAATRGTLLTTSVEHVTALPLDERTAVQSEFLRMNARGAGYLRLTDGGLALALSLAGGYNLQLKSDSETYPDRLFYVGGVSTVRGFEYDSMVPEDIAREVLASRISISDVGVRGGDLFINPRIELRIPATNRVSFGVFLDSGNVWSKSDSIDSVSELLSLRYAAGTGVRANTPIGPIALDGGIKLVRRPWEDIGSLHFSIGLF